MRRYHSYKPVLAPDRALATALHAYPCVLPRPSLRPPFIHLAPGLQLSESLRRPPE